MTNVKAFERSTESMPIEAKSSRNEQTRQLARTLFESLPLADKKMLALEFSKLAGTDTDPQPEGLLATVVDIVSGKPRFTVSELKQQVDERGVPAAPKEIYNAIGYLARIGRVRRVGYGRYIVDGMEIATSDDFGQGDSRHEDEYRTNQGD